MSSSAKKIFKNMFNMFFNRRVKSSINNNIKMQYYFGKEKRIKLSLVNTWGGNGEKEGRGEWEV